MSRLDRLGREPLAAAGYCLPMSVAVNIGEAVPDIELATTDGRHVSLASFRGEATALIFMRHLG